MNRTFEVREIEMAFFTSQASSSPDSQLRFIHSPGFPVSAVQYWRLDVSAPGREGREHLVFFPPHPAPSAETLEEIAAAFRRHYPNAQVSRPVRSAEGEAEILAEGDLAESAAAVAEVQRSGGWDESPVFRVVANGKAFGVELRWRNGRSEATVSEEAG